MAKKNAFQAWSLIMLLLFSYSFGYAQAQLLDLPTVIPPSPTAASLGKYGDIDVGKYTGIPNISIPLYNLSLGNLNVPIDLNYSSSGLKVEEKSSWIGLGWSLNAGGVITRSVHNKADEQNGYWTHANWTDAQILGPNSLTNDNPFFLGIYDFEPDIFYFNYLGKSGKFVMDATSNHDAHCIPYQNVKIDHSSTLSSFTITDDMGNIYLFDAIETTTTGTTVFPSAWFLSKITTTAGIITFTYFDNLEFTSSLQFSEADYVRIPGNPHNKPPESSVSDVESSSKVLKQIDAPGQSIKFYVSRNRKDIPLCSVLDYFTVEDGAGKIKKTISFTHSYFGNINSTNPDAVRLKLDAVIESSLTTQNQKSYSIDYYTPTDIPLINAKSQDYWGYYNGIPNNTLLPPLDPIYDPVSLPVGGGNRNPVFDKALSGTIKSISYPTGGKSTFEYESNDYGLIGLDEVNENVLTQSSVIASAIKSSLVNIPLQTQTFTISYGQKTKIEINGQYTGVTPVDDGPMVTLKRVNANGSKTTIVEQTLINNNSVQYTDLLAANYEITASVDGANQNASIKVFYTSLSGNILKTKTGGGIRIKKIINTDPVTRQDNVRNFDYSSKTDPYRSSGHLISKPALTQIMLDLYVARSSYSTNYLASTQGSCIGYNMVTEYDSDNTGGTNGKTEYYFNTYPPNQERVLSHVVSPAGGQRYFASGGAVAARNLITDYDAYRGLLMRTNVYNSNGILIKELINTYNLNSAILPTSPNYFELTIKKGYNFSYHYGPGSNQYVYYEDMGVTKIISPWIYKTGTTERNYDKNGITYIETSETFLYNNPTHAQLTKTETVNSVGGVISSINKYPQDNFSGLSIAAEQARQSLISKHIISPILENSVFKNNTIPISKIQTDYKNWPSGITLPENIKFQNGANTIEPGISFNQYDNMGNVLEQQKADNIKQSYIWDYNKQYAVAEIINASVSGVAYTSFEADGTGNWTFLGTPITDYNPATGKKSYNLSLGPITKTSLNSTQTYAVTYWSRSGVQNVNNIATSVTGYTTGGGWQFFKHKIFNPTTITVSGTGIIDELRLYPIDALMTTYTYDPLIGMTSQSTPNNDITYYIYDDFGRLKLIKDQNGKILKKYCYNYAGQTENCAVALPTITPSVTNNGTGASGFTATYTNVNTAAVTIYNIPSSSGSLILVSGTNPLPSGNYNLSVAKTANAISYTFGSGCGQMTTDGNSATFYNISISPSDCKTITIANTQ